MSTSTDKFTIACPQCGETVAVSRAHVGKKGRCGICHTIFPITASDDFVYRPAELPAAAPQVDAAANSIWDNPNITPRVEPIEAAAPTEPSASMANDYLNRARNDKGSAIEQEESDATYRFMTSYGSVIGGIVTILLGLLLAFIALVGFGSPKLTAAALFFMVGGGIGWLVQGMNYVTYYHWKDRGGRG